MENPTPGKTVLAGIAGGLATNVAMLLTFRLLGFGWEGGGILLDPALQSPKLIDVWTRLEPIPLVASRPPVIITGLIILGIGHAFIYRWLSRAWPAGIGARTWRMALLLFFFSYLFWEFFTPFNQFGEPLALIGIELLFWAVIALSEALAIAVVMEGGRKSRIVRSGNADGMNST
jgi:hypothetical protein